VRLPSVLVLVGALAGCAQVHSTLNLSDAENALEGARAAGASRTAPYELYSAAAYLEKAREEVGFAQYGAAAELAERSRRFSERAKEKAVEAASRPAPVEAR
jgi:Domain of unknown function (DUF4398)